MKPLLMVDDAAGRCWGVGGSDGVMECWRKGEGEGKGGSVGVLLVLMME
jgi:predicted Rossmann-fold nucleotide-binding protein